MTSKDIYSKLIATDIPNRSKLYWSNKFELAEYDWENFFSEVLYNKLTPRKIHDFNFNSIQFNSIAFINFLVHFIQFRYKWFII